MVRRMAGSFLIRMGRVDLMIWLDVGDLLEIPVVSQRIWGGIPVVSQRIWGGVMLICLGSS
jgi:hypothetical protein